MKHFTLALLNILVCITSCSSHKTINTDNDLSNYPNMLVKEGFVGKYFPSDIQDLYVVKFENNNFLGDTRWNDIFLKVLVSEEYLLNYINDIKMKFTNYIEQDDPYISNYTTIYLPISPISSKYKTIYATCEFEEYDGKVWMDADWSIISYSITDKIMIFNELRVDAFDNSWFNYTPLYFYEINKQFELDANFELSVDVNN